VRRSDLFMIPDRPLPTGNDPGAGRCVAHVAESAGSVALGHCTFWLVAAAGRSRGARPSRGAWTRTSNRATAIPLCLPIAPNRGRCNRSEVGSRAQRGLPAGCPLLSRRSCSHDGHGKAIGPAPTVTRGDHGRHGGRGAHGGHCGHVACNGAARAVQATRPLGCLSKFSTNCYKLGDFSFLCG
jgi:hypothetical protein